VPRGTTRRRWPLRLLALGALGATLLAVVAVVEAAQRPMDCAFDRAAWHASRAAKAESAERHDRSGWPVTQLVKCRHILHGRSRAEVKALLGAADDDRSKEQWIYDIGLPGPSLVGGYISDTPALSISFDTTHRVYAVTAVGTD
jgi:hypothetical protein